MFTLEVVDMIDRFEIVATTSAGGSRSARDVRETRREADKKFRELKKWMP